MNIKAEAIEAAQAMARQQGLQISSGQLMLVLGAFLQAGGYDLADTVAGIAGGAPEDAEHAERMKTLDGYSMLVSIRARIAAAEAEAADLPGEEGDWQYKVLFDFLLEGEDSVADEVRAVLRELDRRFPEYYDPDTTYKEDSEAWIGALDELIEDMRKEIAGESAPEESYGYR